MAGPVTIVGRYQRPRQPQAANRKDTRQGTRSRSMHADNDYRPSL